VKSGENAADTTFNAAASAAGYLYQARLALALCIPYVNSQSAVEVSIERLDDISFESKGTPLELLQTKHHVDRIGNLSDASPDLWKTLRVWSEAVASEPSLPSRTRLFLITTGRAPDQSAASRLRPTSAYPPGQRRDPKSAQEILSEVAQTSKNQLLKPAFSAFLALVPQMRSSLLSAVEIVDQQPILTDLDAVLEEALRLVAPRGKASTARELLEGWWWPRVCKALMASPAEAIPIASLEAKIDDIRDMLKRDALIADLEHAEPSESEVADFDGFRFVKQLRVIGLGANRLRAAKRDYYRAFAQRSKWTRFHVVLDEELERFEATLIEEWEPRFHAMCDAHNSLEPDEATLQQAGQEIYQWVETEARFPFRSLSARFLNVGSYNMLANDLRVGWHREYLKLCKDES
jgi:hypothetical protein